MCENPNTTHKSYASYASVTAGAGFESLENYSFLSERGMASYIKPTNYEQRKKKSSWAGRFEDMVYDEGSNSFTCKNGKRPNFVGTRSRKSDKGFERVTHYYECAECAGCPLRNRCSRAADEEHEALEVCREFEARRRKSLENISSETGILYRINRSIQIEGTFGILKQDWNFRRFPTRGHKAATTHLGLPAFAFNIRKLHSERQNERTRTPLILPNPV